MLFDQYSDADKKPLEKLANILVIKPRSDIDQLPDRSFALIVVGRRRHRQFPVCDPESTLLSLLYFLKNRKIMPPSCVKIAGARIKEACYRFGIETEGHLDDYPLGMGGRSHVVSLEGMKKEAAKLSADQRNDLPDSAFGLVIEGENGEKVRRFPMHDKAHTLKAIQFFSRAKGLSPEQRDELATNIARRAKEFGIETSIGKTASLNPNIVRDMVFRSRYLDDEAKATYVKVAEMARDGKIGVKEAAAVVAHLDKKHGISDYKHRMSPEEVVEGGYQSVFEKSASAREFARGLLEGKLEKTASANPGERIQMILENPEQKKSLVDRLAEQFGDEVASGIVTEPATIFDSLPKPHQEIIEQIIEQVENEG